MVPITISYRYFALFTIGLLVNLDFSTASVVENQMKDVSGRIVGGEMVEPNEFPWLTYVTTHLTASYELLAGTLISNRCVLTRMTNYPTPVRRYDVSMGSNKHNDVTAVRFFDIKDFESYPYIGDDEFTAVIIHLPENVTFSEKVSPIRVPKKEEVQDHVGDSVVVAGWGYTANDQVSPPDVAYKMNATVITNEECSSVYSTFISNNTMCTDGTGGKGICFEDIGAPLNYYDEEKREWVAIGLAVAFQANCEAGYPSLFYKLGDPGMLDWIESKCGPTGLQLYA